MKSNRPVDNSSSVLLSNDENDTVFKLLGPRCSTLATTVVQVLTTEAPAHDHWVKRHTGVLCFVKDGSKRSYYFRLYCPQKKMMTWEHEIYNEIKYLGPRTFFHTFEGEDAMIGFSFANEDEANKLIAAVHSKLESRQRRREERRARISSNKAPTGDGSIEFRKKQISPDLPNGFNNKPKVMQLSESSLTKNKYPRGKFRKEDIGLPKDFVHVFHVGPDAQDKVDDTLKEFFHKVGISDTHLRDQKTRTFIYDFINDHGGMDAVKHEVQTIPGIQPRPPPIPSRTTPVSKSTPPPPPSRTVAPSSPAPVLPVQHPVSPPAPPAPPMVPPSRQPPARPPQATPPPPSQVKNAPPPPPPPPSAQPQQAVPPPPPPPPMEGLLNHPLLNITKRVEDSTSSPVSEPAQNSVKSTPVIPDTRAALMDSIRNAPTLKKVQVERKASITDSRSNLLNAIREGVELKSVPVNATPKPEEKPMDGLAGALARALRARQNAVNPDTESESENTDDEEDWN